MKQVEKQYRCVPFWSWNDKLNKDELVKQVEWMNENGVGGFFMHARGGLKTEYLGKEWFECIDACSKRAQELGMEAYAYDENGWPSGFVGGKLLEDLENHDRYITHSFGEYDKNALVSYDITTSALKRAKVGDENCLNLYEHYSTSTADILNPEVVDKFIEMTHEKYKKRDKYDLKGFFTDEPQYFRWGTPYTKMLPIYFKENYNEDILDGLGLLFVEKRGYRDFRYKYWRALQELMLENFAKKIYDWCDKYGYKLTGHYIEENCLAGQMLCCGGIMPFYEYEHIPGIDYLGRGIDNELSPKQVSSVSAQLGKKQILTETFAACGWNISPMDLKKIGEMQYVAGVNLMCQHLLPYKESGQRKRDYPAHFSSINPWVKEGFSIFNDYFSYLGKLIANSDEVVNVGVLHPIRSAYFDYKRTSNAPYNGLEKLEKSMFGLIEKLCRLGIGHHYIDETILAKHGRVENDSLIVGKCKYDYIILPDMYTMDKTTEAFLKEYASNGGKILLDGKKPQYLEGKRFTYNYLKTNTGWDEIVKSQPYSVKNNKDVRIAYRRDENGNEFIYAVNLGDEITLDFDLKNGSSFNDYGILNDKNQVISTSVYFDAGQSRLLYVSNEEPKERQENKRLTLNGSFTVEGKLDNYITLDTLSYSLNGVDYTEPRYHMCALDELLKMKYKGRVYLKYSVKINTPPEKCLLLAEEMGIISISVNGKSVNKEGKSPLELAKECYNIAKALKKGENEIIIEIDYYQGENVYYALFGENVTESLKNCLAYDTDIEPIYLYGDFGVYGDFEQGKNEAIILGNNFYIDKQKSEITSLECDGYPFISGQARLKKKINLSDTGYVLYIEKSFHLAEIYVNGTKVGEMMLERSLDISHLLKVGENEIEVVLTLGNRNLLGPFHTNEEEPYFVGPETFERFGSWENGKSRYYNPKYAFVKALPF